MAAAACTIIARNYLAQARTLIDSYLRHHPAGRFYLLVVDGAPGGVSLPPQVTVLGPDDLHISAFHEMSFKYDVTELCTAVKPSLLGQLLDEHGESQIVYFDPDVVLFRPLVELWELLEAADVVLIPHLLDPIPQDGLIPAEQDILAAGAYNLGFIALNRSVEVHRLLEWWRERLEDKCRVDIAHALFVDQKWMDLVPGLFAGSAILRDETYDVAYWNLHSRKLAREDDVVTVNGRPLAFFHYSGYDPAHPRSLSKHQTRLKIDEGSALAYLLDGYRESLYRFGNQLARRWRYGYSSFSNGIGVISIHRRLYQTLEPSVRLHFGDPFVVNSDGSSFF